ncbi:hypothetical protein [Paraburkholderia silvatlantica]|uniref:hypothetical protein n=1 Tax=Paraburkholderia silvatlantica TaxID=321895 RepID=UPI00105E7A46|nr:hypothetical protein [Paraburkholderia silvatlantica]
MYALAEACHLIFTGHTFRKRFSGIATSPFLYSATRPAILEADDALPPSARHARDTLENRKPSQIRACDKQRVADQEALLREAFTALDRGGDRGQRI